MKIKISCALTVLSFLCYDYASAGALKKKYNDDKQEKVKHDDAVEDEGESGEAGDAVEEAAAPSESSKEAPDSDSNNTSALESGNNSVASSNSEENPVEILENKKVSGDPVVLKIGRKEFRRSQIIADLKMIPTQFVKGISPDKLFSMLLDQKMGSYLMTEQARKAGLDKTTEFIEKVESTKDELLIKMFMMRELAPKVDNEQVLKSRYEKYKREFKKTKEHQIYHIMLSSEEDAKQVLAALNKGEDFSKLAKEKSIAPSKTKGGEEGYVPLDILPADMKNKLKPLKQNEYTKEFLKTDAGFHIFKIGNSRDSSPKEYEELKEALKHLVMQDEYMKMVERLAKQYNVEKFNDDGTPMTGDQSTIGAAATIPAAVSEQSTAPVKK